MIINQVQKNTGPPMPMPKPKLPNEPVETLMKLNAMAKFDRKPSVRRSSGLMPNDSRCASSRAICSFVACDWSTVTWLLLSPTPMVRPPSGKGSAGFSPDVQQARGCRAA